MDEKNDLNKSLCQLMFDNMLNSYAYCKMIYENGVAIDYIYLKVNGSFLAVTGVERNEGQKVSEILPGIRERDPHIFEIFRKSCGNIDSGNSRNIHQINQ